VKFSLRVARQLYSGKSAFQDIAVYHSDELGNFLTLDGYLMLTEKDEFIYHEMIAHVPMATNPAIRDVLVVGAGDGGTVRELARYDGIRGIDLVEIDAEVVRVCREFFPGLTRALDDPRVRVRHEDGLKFVRSRHGEYDLVVVDSTDPFGPGEGLFTKEFYGNCAKALREGGILVNQHESVFYAEYAQAMHRAHKILQACFPVCRVYQAHIPTYPSGHWLFGFASKGPDPLDADGARWDALGIRTRYYNSALHKGAFALPTYVREQLERGGAGA
jgi:spermidine synthase